MNNSLTLDAEVLQNLIYIAEDESLMKKLSRYMRRLLQTKENETLMSREDFFARVDEAKRGKSARMLPDEDLTAFLKRQGYDL